MAKLEKLSEEDPTKEFPRVGTPTHICRYNPSQPITSYYHRTNCGNCVRGKIKLEMKTKRLVCTFYPKG